MKIFDKNQFLELSQLKDFPVVSIYIPTARMSNNGYQEDIINFKNQLSIAEKELIEKANFTKKDAHAFLENAKHLLEDFEFWQHSSDLLACFISKDNLQTFKLPIDHKEIICRISNQPYLMPLTEELNGNGHYYLLLLNLDRIHLFEATRNVIQEINLDEEEVAVSFTTEEEQDENQKQLHGQGGVGVARPMYHGHGDGSDEEKKVTVLNYFHRMTNMLEPKLNKNPLPLFITGVEYLGPIFREACKYSLLKKGQVIGGFTVRDMDLLHEKSWELAKEIFDEELKAKKEDFGLLKSKNLAVHAETEIIKTALTGGVHSLFISKSYPPLWGSYDEANHQLNRNGTSGENNHCLIDLAATKTIEFGGDVYVLDPEEMPTEHPFSATLRYEI